jgi:hypothetical protein
MRMHAVAATLLALTLSACVVVETGVDVPCRIGTQAVTARAWVQPDPSTSGQGEWALWFDTVLVPIDAVASLVWSVTNDEAQPTRTRGPRLLAVPTRTVAVLLPFFTACPDLYHAELEPARVVLGLYWEEGRLDDVAVPEGASVADVRAAIIDALCELAPKLPRHTIESRVHSVELLRPDP